MTDGFLGFALVAAESDKADPFAAADLAAAADVSLIDALQGGVPVENMLWTKAKMRIAKSDIINASEQPKPWKSEDSRGDGRLQPSATKRIYNRTCNRRDRDKDEVDKNDAAISSSNATTSPLKQSLVDVTSGGSPIDTFSFTMATMDLHVESAEPSTVYW
ncbi:unnamed protein product [Peronospora belbahrii]|uniref:Uncharacterized protein n=1 Tax=Peronospora belbahrii TaxID=622444 RepID=A0ABN8DAM2_9STRA|nr:unnamed protein product [Peronospora belbahrii]